MKKLPAILLCGMLCASTLYPAVTTKRIDQYPGKTIIYYQDGKEVAREIIDGNGNLKTVGAIPDEYYAQGSAPRLSSTRKGKSGKATKDDGKNDLLVPYAGEMSLQVNPAIQLGGLTRGEFVRFRTGAITKYEQLNIYAPTYDPFAYPHGEIYNSITFGVNWTDFSLFYVCNPYLLIILSKPTHVVAFAERCGLSEVQYRNGSIEETYRGEQAVRFFDFLALEPNLSQAVRIWMINAQDAGLPYAAIDQEKCKNIDFSWRNTPENIAHSIYSLKAVYHVGSYKLNNISPECSKATLRIKALNQYTCIYVKLWKNKPASKDAVEDFAYIVKVIP